MPNCQAQIFTATRLSKMPNLTYFALQNATYKLSVTAPNNDQCGRFRSNKHDV